MSNGESDIVLFTASWCPSCLPAKEFLEKHGLAYSEIDIEEHPEAAKQLESATGKLGIPFLRIDGVWVQAYSPGGGPFPRAALESALGIESP